MKQGVPSSSQPEDHVRLLDSNPDRHVPRDNDAAENELAELKHIVHKVCVLRRIHLSVSHTIADASTMCRGFDLCYVSLPYGEALYVRCAPCLVATASHSSR